MNMFNGFFVFIQVVLCRQLSKTNITLKRFRLFNILAEKFLFVRNREFVEVQFEFRGKRLRAVLTRESGFL